MENDQQSVNSILEKIALDLNDSYVAMVNDYAQEQSTTVFTNSSFNHARYITCKMLSDAKQNVCILAGTLNEVFIDSIIEIMEVVAKNLTSIKIITLQETNIAKINKYRTKFQALPKKDGKDIVEYLPLNNTGDSKNFSHFYVMDETAWRKEDPHREKPLLDDIHAEVCFNNPKKGKALQDYFNSLWQQFALPREA